MKNTGQYFYSPVNKAPSRKHNFRPKPLKALSTKAIWRILEKIESELSNPLFYSEVYIKTLRKRKFDLSRELNDRIEYDEWLCRIKDQAEKRSNPLGLDKTIEEFRKSETEAPRRFVAKVYVRGSRLRPGKKVDYRRSGR